MMKQSAVWIQLAILGASVPWFFTVDRAEVILGFPAWAFYSFGATVLYAVVVAVLIGWSWEEMAGEDDDED